MAILVVPLDDDWTRRDFNSACDPAVHSRLQPSWWWIISAVWDRIVVPSQLVTTTSPTN